MHLAISCQSVQQSNPVSTNLRSYLVDCISHSWTMVGYSNPLSELQVCNPFKL